jgi:carbamoyltransferase
MSKVLGVKCSGHDTGAALIVEGRIVAIAEERLNRIKHSFNMFPHLSINYCLAAFALNPSDIELVVIDKVGLRNDSSMRKGFDAETKGTFGRARVEIINHHDAHAASAYFASSFAQAAVLVYDGSGERSLNHHGVYATETETLYRGLDNRLESFQKTTHARVGEKFYYTFGVGKLYSFLSNVYLDFGPYNQGKMMGLAPYGDLSLIQLIPEERWFTEVNGHVLCNPHFSVPRRAGEPILGRLAECLRRFGKLLLSSSLRLVAHFQHYGLYRPPSFFTPIQLPKPARSKQDTLPDQYYASVARAGQHILEQVAIRLGKRLRGLVDSRNLCIAGGLGLNIDANRNFLEKVGFEELFVQPGASDTGIPLGCALWGYHMILGEPRFYKMQHAYLGRSYTEEEIHSALEAFDGKIIYRKSSTIAKDAATLLSEGKILGWFEGGSEYGPRSLGHRSILADARSGHTKDVLNQRVKHREKWRPFGAAILKEKLSEYFELEHESPFMLLAAKARPGVREKVPSVIHVDNTSRIQTVTKALNGRFFELIEEFYKLTGVPMVLNTSFNIAGDPIVETPEDALRTFTHTDMDYLIIENVLIKKNN